ncbi:MAG TPA: hypothetical protein VGN12_24420 [Pirellulales bacterium]|jgi:hypothetical protein
MCAKKVLLTSAVFCLLGVVSSSAIAQRTAAMPTVSPRKAPTSRDKYFLAAAEVYDELAAEHARLAELYRALPDRDKAVKAHAASVRTEVQFAQRNYRLISEEARRDAEISQRLKEIADREAVLLEKINKLSPPVAVPAPRPQRATSVFVEREQGGTRIPQSYYTSGEGHFID